MKLGTFLLGGIVGAAAAVYVSKRAKPMLFSALSSNDAASGLLGSRTGKSGKSADSHSFGAGVADVVKGSMKGKKDSSIGDASLGADGLGTVNELIQKDPKLKEAVDEILAGSSAKDKQADKESHTH
ncbi:hypothetical protein SAMN02799630_00463 [Paenibacillus sp. UNCCL117]|nr:hypothetical protein SAMN04488602_10269 [Paenibacillus sp. cl123]SFW14116.1 hypothetical protein SAMN02799630_00463 [Paenibacillus sp. UNCCL117]